MKYQFIKIGIKGLLAVGIIMAFAACSSNKNMPKRQKRCNDCPRFSEQMPEKPTENTITYEHIG